MPCFRLSRFLAPAALTSVLAVTGAQAAIYTGSWDPAFGPALPSLGWRGTATYSVPDACLALGDGNVFNSDPCSGGAMSVLNASVSFYNLSNPTVTLETLIYSSWTLTSISVANHKLAGTDAPYSRVVHSNLSIAGNGAYSFALKFDDATAMLAYVTEPESSGKVHYFPSTVTPPAVTFTLQPVPEPATLALWAAGVAAVGGVARRRSSRRR